jgi:hypothetical protein
VERSVNIREHQVVARGQRMVPRLESKVNHRIDFSLDFENVLYAFLSSIASAELHLAVNIRLVVHVNADDFYSAPFGPQPAGKQFPEMAVRSGYHDFHSRIFS